MSGPESAQKRVERLLVMLPWLSQRGRVRVDEMAATFGVSPRQLVRDLETASLCGLPPYVDELIDLYVDDGWVHAGVPRVFTRPPRLTAEEGVSLLAAARAALQLPGADRQGPLERALDKLEAVLGTRVAVRLERPAALDVVQSAIDGHERLAVTYYTPSRDEVSERVLAPQAVFTDDGKWYVVADDSASGEERRFRVDRMETARLTGERFTPRPVERRAHRGLALAADAVAVTLLVEPEARWLLERTPLLSSEPQGDGRVRARLAVASERWLASLLVQAGPAVTVEGPPALVDLAARTARRLLARYPEAG